MVRTVQGKWKLLSPGARWACCARARLPCFGSTGSTAQHAGRFSVSESRLNVWSSNPAPSTYKAKTQSCSHLEKLHSLPSARAQHHHSLREASSLPGVPRGSSATRRTPDLPAPSLEPGERGACSCARRRAWARLPNAPERPSFWGWFRWPHGLLAGPSYHPSHSSGRFSGNVAAETPPQVTETEDAERAQVRGRHSHLPCDLH